MKKCLIFLSIFTLLTFAAPAEGLKFTDLTELTAEELMVLRQEEAAYLTKISAELGKRVQAGETVNPDEVIGTIAELFPDPNLAKVVRDKAGKFSVSQPVTQADLDSITSLGLWNVGDITDLTGIGRIRNLESINAGDISLQYLPDEMRALTKLKTLRITRTNLMELPEWIGELTNLTSLDLNCDGNKKGSLTRLPDSIGNLVLLTEIRMGGHQLTTLPESMGNLINLKTLYLPKNNISEIPESLWALKLESLSLTGNPVE